MKRVLVVAGGTGGHIFPALAFGQYLVSKVDRVVYVTGSRPLEKEIFSALSLNPLQMALEGSPFGGVSLGVRVKRFWQLLKSFFQSCSILTREKPTHCVLFGGYIALPILMAAWLHGIPVAFLEENAVAGKVTRIAARFCRPVAAGLGRCDRLAPSQWRQVGIPVRPLTIRARKDIILEKGLSPRFCGMTAVGILGGSISKGFMGEQLSRMAGTFGNFVFFVLDSAPQSTAEKTTGDVDGSLPSNLVFLGKMWDMSDFYSLVDFVVARSGASTLAELDAYNLPSALIPWKGAADHHQRVNAETFAQNHTTLLLDEDEPTETQFEKLRVFFKEHINTPTRINAKSPGTYSFDQASQNLWEFTESLHTK